MGMGGMGMGGMGMGGMGAYGGGGMGGYGMGGYGGGRLWHGRLRRGQLRRMGWAATARRPTAWGHISRRWRPPPPAPRPPRRRRPGLTGQYLGSGAAGAGRRRQPRTPSVIPNPFDNTLLVQGTPQDWEQIKNLLRQLDVAPRQVLIDAKIYYAGPERRLLFRGRGVSAKQELEPHLACFPGDHVAFNGGLALSSSALVLRSSRAARRAVMAELKAFREIISSPSIIATDSIPAMMTVGEDVPVISVDRRGRSTGSSFNSVELAHHRCRALHPGAREFERRW